MEEFDARVSLIDETLNSGLDPIELLATPILSPLTDLPVAAGSLRSDRSADPLP